MPFAKTTRKRSRIIETIVTLSQASVRIAFWGIVSDLQCADKEHECNTDALAPGHLKAKDLIKWERKHPNVNNDAYRGICPDKRANVNTSSLCLLAPVCPVVGDRLTGEDSDDRKADTVYGVEDQSVLDKTASHLAWEDSEKEQKKRCFKKNNLQEVKDL